MIGLVRKYLVGQYGEFVYSYEFDDGVYQIKTVKGTHLITYPLYQYGDIVGYEIINIDTKESYEVSTV